MLENIDGNFIKGPPVTGLIATIAFECCLWDRGVPAATAANWSITVVTRRFAPRGLCCLFPSCSCWWPTRLHDWPSSQSARWCCPPEIQSMWGQGSKGCILCCQLKYLTFNQQSVSLMLNTWNSGNGSANTNKVQSHSQFHTRFPVQIKPEGRTVMADANLKLVSGAGKDNYD